ncbi:MAG: S8 family peptidase, partial [Mycobacteriales bacterium]
MAVQMMLFPEQSHAHLRLAAAISPGSRLRRPSGFGRPPQHPDRARHGRLLRDEVVRVRSEHAARMPILGVSPELVLVLETNRQLSPDDVERAGLTVLEFRSEATLVAFASDPDMTEFLDRNERYKLGSPGLTQAGNESSAAYQDLFDRIEGVRRVRVTDILSPALTAVIDRTPATEHVRIELQCWCGEDEGEARRRNKDVRDAVAAGGGDVLDHGVRVEAGWSTVCAAAPAGRIVEVIATDRVRWADVLPQPVLNYPELRATTPDDLPLVLAPDAAARIVAVIDSGLRSAHPLIAPAVVGVEYVGSGFGDGGDEAGHGTLVASLALYGSLEEHLAARTPLQPAGRVLSIRVLDAKQQFPDDRSWAKQLMEAMELAAEAGARVINLSLGDPRSPYVPPRPTAVAALIDLFIRAHRDIVVVASVGNFQLSEHSIDSLLAGTYTERLLNGEETGLLDPATAAMALTVGALCGDSYQGASVEVSSDRKHVGAPNLPSPWTRVGPGPMGMVKPELSAPGGSAVVDTLQRRAFVDHATSVVGAGAADTNRLLATDIGTSFAAPLVSHAALRVLGHYPNLSGNAVRALLLASAQDVKVVVDGSRESARREQQRRLTGYGRVSAARSEASTDHRAVLL